MLIDYCAVHVIDMLILRTGLCPLWTFYELGLDSCLGPGTNLNLHGLGFCLMEL